MSRVWYPGCPEDQAAGEKRAREETELNAQGYCGCVRGRARKKLDDEGKRSGFMPDFGCQRCTDGRVPREIHD